MDNRIDTKKIQSFFGDDFSVEVSEYYVSFDKKDRSSLVITPIPDFGNNEAHLRFSFLEPVDVLMETISKIVSIIHGTEELNPNSTNWQLAMDCNQALNDIIELCYKAQETVKAISKRARDEQ